MNFKIVSVKGDEIKIRDSKSKTEEIISGRDFNLLYKYGIRFDSDSSPVIQKLKKLKNGTCVMLRINLKTQKVVFVGKKRDTFVFYDGNGDEGFIEIKMRYILKSSNLYIDFDCEQDKQLKESLKQHLRNNIY